MTKRRSFFASTVVAGLCALGGWAMSDDKQPADAQQGGMDPAMMEAWAKYMTPGEHHKVLEMMAGDFKYTMWWKMSPDQPPTSSAGEYKGEMAMGGRFLMTMVNGEMMGQEFHGMGCLGYDNALKKHVSAWIDNMGTGIMRSEGACDASGKVITFSGEMLDPLTSQMCKYKFVYTIKSNDEFSMQWWSPNPANGELFESMGISYTRAK